MTVQVNTNTLTGPALDWAAAKCEDVIVEYINDGITRRLLRMSPFAGRYSPSTDWAQGGPIIEREDICLTSWYERWDAQASHGRTASRRISGPTPLIAAMRCFVASKLGDTVDVPDELQPQ